MKLGYVLATAAWASTFALSWLMVLGVVEMWPAGGFLAFFFLLAALVSMVLWSPGKKE
jgi:hypothetical protein